MLGLLEFMLKCYQQSIEKYYASNKRTAWVLWFKEYKLTLEKRALSCELYAAMKNFKDAIENQDDLDSDLSEKIIAENSTQAELYSENGFEPPRSIHSETTRKYRISTPGTSVTPIRRCHSVGEVSPYVPLMRINNSSKVQPVSDNFEYVVRSGSQNGFSSSSYANQKPKSWNDQIIDFINAQRNKLSKTYQFYKGNNGLPHAKGTYDDLLKTYLSNIEYIRDREIYLAATLERLRVMDHQESYSFERHYREHLLVLIERVLCMLSFDIDLYKRKHLSKKMKEYYALTGALAKISEENLTYICQQLIDIVEKVFIFESVGKQQFIKVYASYQEALHLFTMLPGTMVEKCCVNLREWQGALNAEYSLCYKGQALADLAAQYIKFEKAPKKELNLLDGTNSEFTDGVPPRSIGTVRNVLG